MDPRTEDPESWECDCYEEGKEACSRTTIDVDENTCLRANYCEYPKVCEHWKDIYCTADLNDLREALRQQKGLALLKRASQSTLGSKQLSQEEILDQTLDQALSSKTC